MGEHAAQAAAGGVAARVDLAVRCVLPELMDDPALPATEHCRALDALGRINWLCAVAVGFRRPLEKLAKQLGKGQVRVLDVATGGGDVPVQLARWAGRQGLGLRFAGCDVSPRAIAWATERAAAHGVAVHFFTHDVVADGIPAGYDVVMSSLFLHHLPTPLATRVLATMGAEAGQLVLVSELQRSPLAYAVTWVGTRLVSASPVVRTDGPLSVRAAFTLNEIRAAAEAAGLAGADVQRQWPFRFLLTWRRP